MAVPPSLPPYQPFLLPLVCFKASSPPFTSHLTSSLCCSTPFRQRIPFSSFSLLFAFLNHSKYPFCPCLSTPPFKIIPTRPLLLQYIGRVEGRPAQRRRVRQTEVTTGRHVRETGPRCKRRFLARRWLEGRKEQNQYFRQRANREDIPINNYISQTQHNKNNWSDWHL